jgi:ribosomal protein S18 acetylase RimI-like enzyme
MNIQRANVSEAEHILDLQKTSYKSEAELYHDHNIPPMTQTLQEMKDDFLYKKFLKVTEGDKIIGSVRAFEKDGTCHVGRLMVHPDFQNQGIGTKLLQEIEDLFDTCKRFELFAGSKSKKNIIFYEKLGYKTFKTEKINENVSLVYMEKIRK